MLSRRRACPTYSLDASLDCISNNPNHTPLYIYHRLEAEVLSGRMWCPTCASLAPPLPDAIPDSFSDAAHYTAVFEPLLHEEAREGARSAWQEARNAGRGWAAAVGRCVFVAPRCRL